MYRRGLGVPVNREMAIHYYQKAYNGMLTLAKEGNLEAQTCLGWMHEHYACVGRNFKEAMK
ncbi:MAG: sel1 repeat family protein [SAR324 cluster bacterium]|nr:sel1 repeat family protein [SAR324 cluster bacterium]